MSKLLQINATANWGSTGRIAEQIGIAAMTKGWDSYIAYGRHSNDSRSKLIKIGSLFDVYNHFLENRILDNEGLSSRWATEKFIEEVKRLAPDVIHLHNIHDHFLNYKKFFEYLNSTSIPVVWTFHDCWPITGHCMHFINKNCERWRTGCYDCQMKGEYPKTWLDQSKRNWHLKRQMFTENKNLVIVACSDWIGKFIKESYLKHKKLQVIHNGCDLEMFYPRPQVYQEKFQILAVSSIWHPQKGELDLYKLRQILPYENYDITIVGLSAEQLKKLPIGIKGIPRTQSIDELASLYSSADVLINPTYEDTFPTINIEALACGTPVITYRTGGSPEAVDLNTGAVVEQGDVVSLRDTLVDFCESKFKEKHSIECRSRAEMYFDKDKCFEQYVSLYESLIQ